MFPMRSRQQYNLPCGSWATSAIGNAFIHVHPLSEFQYYYDSPQVVPGTNNSTRFPVKKVNSVFPKGILTINFLTVITLMEMTAMI